QLIAALPDEHGLHGRPPRVDRFRTVRRRTTAEKPQDEPVVRTFEEPREEIDELIALLGREARPVRPERLLRHRPEVERLAHDLGDTFAPLPVGTRSLQLGIVDDRRDGIDRLVDALLWRSAECCPDGDCQGDTDRPPHGRESIAASRRLEYHSERGTASLLVS